MRLKSVDENNERAKALIRSKIGEYHSRADQLKDHLGQACQPHREERNSTPSITTSSNNLDVNLPFHYGIHTLG